MNRRNVIVGCVVMALVASAGLFHSVGTSNVSARPVRLVITGPDGQRFSGSYIADGVTNSVSAITPATIGFRARNVAYDFKRQGGDAEFRVALYVGELCRTSATSNTARGVRGELRYAATKESYWAAGY